MTSTQWRLDSKDAAVANAFRKATEEQRRHAVLVACEAIVPIVGLQDNEDVSAGVRALREARSGEPDLRERLIAISERFDEEYFRLDEAGEEAEKSEALRFFARARAASAVAFALSADSSSLHEAIYEAMSALIDDPSRLLRVVGPALST
jgi:hypothetical protein